MSMFHVEQHLDPSVDSADWHELDGNRPFIILGHSLFTPSPFHGG